MKKISTIIIAVALLMGMAQCKKQETPASEGNVVRITLNVGGNGNGSRVDVDPTANQQVQFENGDQIVVASSGAVVGTLTCGEDRKFTGEITDSTEGQPLYSEHHADGVERPLRQEHEWLQPRCPSLPALEWRLGRKRLLRLRQLYLQPIRPDWPSRLGLQSHHQRRQPREHRLAHADERRMVPLVHGTHDAE